MKNVTIVEKMENFITKYVTFPDANYSVVASMWTLATYSWDTFDAFPYMAVCGVTKQSGKTRFGVDVMQFAASNARPYSCKSASSLFRDITEFKPTVLLDEAEVLSSEEANEMREILNKGYRRGQSITKVQGGKVQRFDTYCPKVFILIGDVNDTLKDRSIVLWMRRADPAHRFNYGAVEMEGRMLRDEVKDVMESKKSEIAETYMEMVSNTGLPFLSDRDEEIWLPLFAICKVIAPHRLDELTRAAVDMCAEKTADIRRFDSLREMEKDVQDEQYGVKLIQDLLTVINGEKGVATIEAIDKLKAIQTAPWRKFRGVGLTPSDMGALLDRFGVGPKPIRFQTKGLKGSERNKSANGAIKKGYSKDDLRKALEKVGKPLER